MVKPFAMSNMEFILRHTTLPLAGSQQKLIIPVTLSQ
jgi:hypothetical protein